MSVDICKKCGCEKIIYYGVYCPICTKPKVKEVKYINLIEALYYIEYKGNLDYKEKFWDKFVEYHNFSNDSFIYLHRDDFEKDHFINDFFDKMGIKEESILVEISW